jgi:hypothetical protein
VLRFIKLNPASILLSLNALIALAVAWGWKPTPDVTAGIIAGVTALITIVTAASTRPVGLQAIVGGVSALAAAAVAVFSLPVSSVQIGSAAAVLSIVLAGIFHLAHVPVSAARKGTTADAIQLSRGGLAR